jgi:hypothetical protein
LPGPLGRDGNKFKFVSVGFLTIFFIVLRTFFHRTEGLPPQTLASSRNTPVIDIGSREIKKLIGHVAKSKGFVDVRGGGDEDPRNPQGDR